MNLATIIDGHDADAVALISRGLPTTYGQLRDQVAALRGSLLRLGLGRGDSVAILCENVRYFVDSYLAIVGVGAVAVPLNPSSPAVALEREIAVTGAKFVVVGPMGRATWQQVDRSTIPSVEHVIVTDGRAAGGAINFDDLLSGDPAPIIDVDPDDLAVLMFTSGTAAAPQAAMLSHRNLLSNIEQSLSARDRVITGDVVFGVLPMNHIFGLNVMLGLSLHAGSTIVLIQRFDPSTALDTIAERKVTVIPGAPPMWVAWSQFAEADRGAFASVRLALSGAARLPEEVSRAFEARFGIGIRQGYGLTEASPVVTTSAGIPIRTGSIGKVLDGVEVRLVDSSGGDVLVDDPGEIWVRGPNVFRGYFNDPEATRQVLDADGWLHTGDIAVMDQDGYLFIVDRVKDLVIVSGFNVFPAEVEEVLLEHPGVAEAAVVGVPHPYTGEAVKAFVVAARGADLHEEELIAFCMDRLPRYKAPTKILFTDELPRNPGGKLLRRVLR